MSLGQIIKKRRAYLGLTLKEVASKVGVAEATIQRYESGEIKNLRHDKIDRLASALELSPAILMGWQDEPTDPFTTMLPPPQQPVPNYTRNSNSDANNFQQHPNYPPQNQPSLYEYSADTEFTPKARRVARAYMTLDPHGQELVDLILSSEIRRIEEIKDAEELARLAQKSAVPESTPSVIEPEKSDSDEFMPLLTHMSPAAAGRPLTVFDASEVLNYPKSAVPHGTDFAVHISGDSMEPRIHDGDVVFVRKQDTLENSEIGIFIVNSDEALCKKLHLSNGSMKLVSLNTYYQDMDFTEFEEVRIVGKVLGTTETNKTWSHPIGL